VRGDRAAELIAVLLLVLGTWLGFATAGPPGVVPASASPARFSAARALADLHAITLAPHPVGSADHDRIRDYLVDRLRALNCDDVHVQSATGFNTLDGPLAATVANVVCRKRGAHPGHAVLLSAHYDAVPRSFGAGDDGAGVAAILETLRALDAGPPLANDVIVTIVDAEEEGLLGTEAFVDLHPWARDVAVVLNFDGRGVRGPVYMFQTSPGNAALIDALAAVPSSRANSLTGEVYRHLPSDTDLSVWLHSALGVAALNFAQVNGYPHYHTPIDNPASLDPRVVQQMGDYALTLARQLTGTDTISLHTSDVIYFNAPLVGIIRYPGRWALMLAIAGLVLAVVLVGLCATRRLITLSGAAGGAGALLATLLLPALVTLAAWRVIALLHPGYGAILQGEPYNARWYLWSAIALTVAIALTTQQRLASRVSPLEGAVAPLLVWGVLGVVVAARLPGASYLFAWPLFAATLALSWWRHAALRERVPAPWLALLAVPALVLWPPLVAALEAGLTVAMLPACVLLLALMLSLLTLPLELAGEWRRDMARLAVAAAIVLLAVAELTSGFTAERKRPDSLAYLVDADAAKAWWVSTDRTTDPWTMRVLGKAPDRRAFRDFDFEMGPRTLLAATAATPAIGISPVQLVHDVAVDSGRRLQLHVARSGSGEMVTVAVDSGVAVSQMSINGRALQDGNDDRYSPHYHAGANGTVLRYFGVPEEGVDLEFTLHTAAPAVIRIVAAVEGFPSGPAPGPRPPDLMSKPFVPTDMTITAWTVRGPVP